ncbi:MAG: hypothetical protein R2780_03530 [Crocinitomicaceae bacterium]|nr:hypothetical protein [Crocinitomicaceae bacterium]
MLRKAISFIVYSNIWISAGAFGFGWLFFQLNELQPDIPLLLFLFSSTLVTYNFQRYERIAKNEKLPSPRIRWMTSNIKLVKALLFIGALTSLILIFQFKLLSIIILSLGGLVSFLYVFAFNILNRRSNLRDIPGIKIYLISLVWAISCALIPYLESADHQINITKLFIAFFLYILGITIPFDIRDIELDEFSKKTIPQLVGTQISKVLAFICIFASYFLLTYPLMFNPYLFPAFALTILLISMSNKNRNELYYSFFIDGLLVVLPLSYYLLHNL